MQHSLHIKPQLIEALNVNEFGIAGRSTQEFRQDNTSRNEGYSYIGGFHTFDTFYATEDIRLF